MLINNLKSLIYLFVKYRIHLSLLFAIILFSNNFFIGKEIDWYFILSFSFWHFSLFLFDRVYDRKIDILSQPDEYVKEKYARSGYVVTVLSLVSSVIFYLLSGYPIWIWFMMLPLVFLYPLRIYNGLRVKSIFLVKNLYSALLIYSLPLVLQTYLLESDFSNYILICSLFIYVMIGEVFWDIRDMEADLLHKTITIPNYLGLKFSKYFIFSLVLIDYLIKGDSLSLSGWIYLALIISVTDKSDRLVFHVPPLLALLNFVL
jgi:4-hydroxybenzoate polyprenyltransferase